MDEDLDRQIRSELFLKPPLPDACFGIMGYVFLTRVKSNTKTLCYLVPVAKCQF